MTSGRSDLIDIAATVMHETKNAFLLDHGAGPDNASWFPKSLVEDNGDGTFAVPEWLAKHKGAI